ncbi:MAG TPA: SDR family oxidoreductase [Chloroflexota bacterium]|nr:SDR family oxidoreductase [Chloroflexota bacterium]
MNLDPHQQAVLVTGSSMGLGLETALHLAEKRMSVYAGVLSQAEEPAVLAAASERGVSLEVVPLDITDESSIEAAVERVLSRGAGLYGLVNNAGIGLRGCLEDLTTPEIRAVFEANVIGTMAVTRAVLPAMRAARRGRVVTISSVGGRIASFGLSAYCATKFAQEGFAEALALEIAPFGLHSILVEPGMVKTTRWTVNRGLAQRALEGGSPYQAMFARHEELADRIVNRSKIRPVDVAQVVYRALTDPRPRMRYVVGRPATAAIALRRYLPNRLFERVYFGSLLRQVAPGMRAG